MKLSEKLQKIRKENNITQEGLADRLGVSRQAVSKWESDLAYPDTEKLIQISKIFNISLDELINDNINKNDNNLKKISFMDMVNEVLEFITKSVNMFWAMKFVEKIKCLFEMGILILLIILVSFLSTSVLVELIRKIFSFFPWMINYTISEIFEILLWLSWLVLGFLIVVKIFKNRYLDYYVFVVDSSVTEKKIEEPIIELNKKKEYKVVIRDPKDSSLNIVRKVEKIFLLIAKCFCGLLAVPIIICFVIGVILFVYSLFFSIDGLFFNGISIAILGFILFLYLILEFIYNLLFNRCHIVNRIFILFILSISLIGIGFGISFASLSNFTFLVNENTSINTHEIEMSRDLVIRDMMFLDNSDIVIDDSLDNIKFEITSYGSYDVYLYSYSESDRYNKMYNVVSIDVDYNIIKFYKNVINDLKNKKIVSYDKTFDVRMYISYDNLTMLRENLNKYNGYVLNK